MTDHDLDGRTNDQLIQELRKVARLLHDRGVVDSDGLGTVLGVCDRAVSTLQVRQNGTGVRHYPNEIREKEKTHFLNRPQPEKQRDPLDQPIHHTYGEKTLAERGLSGRYQPTYPFGHLYRESLLEELQEHGVGITQADPPLGTSAGSWTGGMNLDDDDRRHWDYAWYRTREPERQSLISRMADVQMGTDGVGRESAAMFIHPRSEHQDCVDGRSVTDWLLRYCTPSRGGMFASAHDALTSRLERIQSESSDGAGEQEPIAGVSGRHQRLTPFGVGAEVPDDDPDDYRTGPPEDLREEEDGG